MQIAELTNKSIVILGFEKEGQDSFLFLKKKFPEKEIAVADVKELKEFSKEAQKLLKKTRTHLGNKYLQSLKYYDVIVRSPGISPDVIKPFMSKKQQMTSQTSLFFANSKNKIIGVTGTKGKGTTASLIDQVLRKGDVNSKLIGNIGKPSLSFLLKAKKNAVFVYELSSFQLMDLKYSPDIAVVLNLYPEHIDYHGSLHKYAKAKANIVKYQTRKDIVIFDKDNKESVKISNLSLAKKIGFHQKVSLPFAFVSSPDPARIIGKMFGVSSKNIEYAINHFKPLPHRLEPVGTYNGITFINDSMGTTPIAVIAGIETLGDNVHSIILGGTEKGKTSYKELARVIGKSSIKTIILFPPTEKKIWKDIQSVIKKDVPKKFFAKSMKEAVRLCYENTAKGRTCLLSPSAASFHMFKNYADRGEQFKLYIKEYAKKNS